MESEIFRILKSLVFSFGVSGDVEEVKDVIRDFLSRSRIEYQEDDYGVILVGDTKNPKIIVSAHIDEIGFQITRQVKPGRFRIMPVGAISACHLNQQMVQVKVGDKKFLASVFSDKNFREPVGADDFSSLILHTEPKLSDNLDMIGSFGRFAPRLETTDEYILSTSLDNRVCVALMLQMLRSYDFQQKRVLFAFVNDEEMEDHSADSLGFRFRAEIAFVLDYCPVHQTVDPEENLGEDDLRPIVMYRGGKYLLHQRLRDYFDSVYKKYKFQKGFLSEKTVHKLEPSNFEINGKTKAANICLPAYGYHGSVYRLRKKAVDHFSDFVLKVLKDHL